MNKKQRLKKLSFTDKIIIVFVTLLSVFFLIVFAVPIIYILTASVSTASSRILLDILPTKFVFEGYSFLFEDDTVLRALWNSVMYTSIGVAVTMAMTVLSAYPLSVHDFFIGKHMSGFFIFTLYFNGGMIPTYLLVKSLGLLNSMWSLILPSCISVTSIILLTATFQKIIPRSYLQRLL